MKFAFTSSTLNGTYTPPMWPGGGGAGEGGERAGKRISFKRELHVEYPLRSADINKYNAGR